MDNNEVELHDDEQEIVEGQHDMKNAESQSIASVSKAEDGVKKQAPTRRADKRNAQASELKPSKSGMVNAMANKMMEMNKEDLEELFAEFIGDEPVEAENVQENNFDEDLNALVESEGTLSEEFKAKTAVIFEAALKSKLKEEVDRLESQYATELAEELEVSRTEMVEKVDGYLNYVVEQWMEDNQLAVQQGLRTEIAEEFMEKLHGLFVESYIEVPESKVDLVDGLADRVEELEEQLNTVTKDAIEMTEQLEKFTRDQIVREYSNDLAETQVEKLQSLVQSLDFEDEESFAAKVKTVKESYFKKTSNTAEGSSLVEESAEGDEAEVVETGSAMDRYLAAIRSSNKN